MADYAGAAMSLSQGGGRDLSPTSDDQNNDSDQSPRSLQAKTSSKPRRMALPLSSSSPLSETTRKPRGRPPGSKNKPKPPIVITKDSDSAMKPVVLEISAGSDVVDSVIQFARRRRVGITLLSGSGSVSNVTLRHPMSHAPALSLHGPFTLLSLSGSVVGPTNTNTTSSPTETTTSSSSSSPTTSSNPSFGICLAGAQGQVFGGIVGGKVIAASAVAVVATTFVNPSFHRLPGDNQDNVEGTHNHDHQEIKPCVVGGTHETTYTSTSSACTHVVSPTPINCQLSSPDHHVMPSWGHSSRSPY
ncbi:hypothetical protein L484_000140 [Morus notabilis]|uniref:AT-hook motif nuclear-localized protein n=1 Tax=Morus notabilis TaxID=981085 RepID=W9T373_9ROSA|nr:AT-hook motif nuclear-localized protein 28 [Morus notabilis]EXC67061.1 hypothetical protein L484_000140 [Morus notabilis]